MSNDMKVTSEPIQSIEEAAEAIEKATNSRVFFEAFMACIGASYEDTPKTIFLKMHCIQERGFEANTMLSMATQPQMKKTRPNKNKGVSDSN